MEHYLIYERLKQFMIYNIGPIIGLHYLYTRFYIFCTYFMIVYSISSFKTTLNSFPLMQQNKTDSALPFCFVVLYTQSLQHNLLLFTKIVHPRTTVQLPSGIKNSAYVNATTAAVCSNKTFLF